MEWIERLNQTITYIEEHLTDEIDYEELGKVACCSSYHFQRMFAYMAGVPLSEYIRKRKMSLAVVDLLDGEEKVVDIALKYGYNSPTSFNRAFQTVHGMAPSLVRGEGVSIKSFPPLQFKIIVKGVDEMDYRIEKKEAFRIVGVSVPLEKEIEKNFQTVPVAWQTANTDGTIPKLLEMMDTPIQGLMGVSVCNEEETWKYFIAVASTMEAQGVEQFTVPAATWAVFPGSGTNLSLQELEQRIVTEWLPTSGYEYADAPDVELYLNPDPQNTVFEVWIPVVKKAK